MTPFFTVVMATYGRGVHIRASIESILRQTRSDFELIVVGDACRDETAEAVEGAGDARIVWHNLPTNGGSQSGPNNEGLARARGQWLCYLGHDDVWAPDHLACVAATIAAQPEADVVVAGCIYYGCEGSDIEWITGLFDTPDAAFAHFFPPSSVAHRRGVPERAGPWRAPMEIRAPVDADFLLRVAGAGFRFVSTGRITVHKFAAGHRYLSYLRQASGEQSAMLERLALPDRGWIDAIHARTLDEGRLMSMRHIDYSAFEPGALFALNRGNKGIARAPLRPLHEATMLSQTPEMRALDWYGLEGRFRWSGPSRRPKFLVPFTGRAAEVAIEIGMWPPHPPLDGLSVEVHGAPVPHRIERRDDGVHWLCFTCALSMSAETVVTFDTPDMMCPAKQWQGGDSRLLGIRVGDATFAPL